MTVTANDTEENIREAAGFPDAAEPDAPKSGKADEVRESAAGDSDASGRNRQQSQAERNPDGTFKPKEPEAEPQKADSGDPRKSHQAKINQAIAKQRDAERRAEEAERRAAEREAELQALRQPPPAQTPAPQPVSAANAYAARVKQYQSDPDAPKYDDFVAAGLDDPYTAHQMAMAAFIADKTQAEWEARHVAQAQERERQSHLSSALSIAAEKHADFQDLIATNTQAYPPAVVEHLIAEAAMDPSSSADLMHHLLTHPDDAARLATMTHPIAAAREIGRLTALVSASPGPDPAAQTTNAKPLIKPVRTSVMAPESSPPEDLPFGPKYIAAMNERERKAREAKRA